jgi:uncharacterized protein (DUF952 family)
MDAIVYKILTGAQWRDMQAAGGFAGSSVDLADGYIHLSRASQVRETARKHFSGQAGLMLLAVRVAALGPHLRYEPSRGGALFPHLYARLPMAAVAGRWPLEAGESADFRFPDGIAP